MESLEDRQLTIVAIGAHPGPSDMPYQAGGTPAKDAERGHEVVFVSASYEAEWEREIEAMARHLGGSQRWLDFEEGAVFDDPQWAHDLLPIATLHRWRTDERPHPVVTVRPRSGTSPPCHPTCPGRPSRAPGGRCGRGRWRARPGSRAAW